MLPEEKEPGTTSASPEPAYVSDWPGISNLQYAPLTGVALDPQALSSSAISAKVDNHPSARPQWNLSKADLVWEELVEGGLTRYVPTWHSNIPEKIGPVRSIRPMDPDIISPIGGVVAYSGGQQKYVQMMQRTVVQNAIHGYSSLSSYIFRDRSKPSPHNVQVLAKKLIAEKFATVAPPKNQFAFGFDLEDATAFQNGTVANTVNLKYSNASQPSYQYDSSTQKYLRFQLGKADFDAEGVRLSATNIIVLRVRISIDGHVPKTELIGSGSGYVFSGGKAIAINWSKSSMNDQIVLKDADGLIVRLAPGTTWIHPVPTTGTVSFS
ncbi:MAG: DUF3048 domain-containing protein [Microbacteriaceae bacterium]|nr:DUF3048 domain-containing protein [Microbacteriaceae bacterium]